MAARRIALLGAASTGKTTLATELACHLRARGVDAVAVPAAWGEARDGAGCALRPGEQLALAREQERRVDRAAAGAGLVIADTTALMVAAHAGTPGEDDDVLRFALQRQQGYAATLLTGLDIAQTPQGWQGNAAPSREAVDTLVRTLLQRAGVAYQVVYGQGPQRLQAALQALACVLPQCTGAGDGPPETGRPWVWVCDKCSDPACEHRLFSRLKAQRPA